MYVSRAACVAALQRIPRIKAVRSLLQARQLDRHRAKQPLAANALLVVNTHGELLRLESAERRAQLVRLLPDGVSAVVLHAGLGLGRPDAQLEVRIGASEERRGLQTAHLHRAHQYYAQIALRDVV